MSDPMNEPSSPLSSGTLLAAPPAPYRSPASRARRHLRSVLVSGLITAVPLLITLFVVSFIFGWATWLSQPIAKWLVQLLVAVLYAPSPPRAEQAAFDAYWAMVATIQFWSSWVLALLISLA